MPWTKVLCPNNEEKTFDECLACTSTCLDQEVREALFENERHWQAEEHTGDHISATALLGCLRATYLERVINYAATPASQWFSLRGKLIHKLVERPDMDNPYLRRSEMRLYARLNGMQISGQLDNYQLRFLKLGILKDFKSIGDNGLQYIVHEGAKQDHIWQTNIYAWLARQNGYRVDAIEICYMSLMQVVSTGQLATVSEYLKNQPAPTGKRKRMVGQPRLVKTYPSGKKKWDCTYQIPPVPIYADQQIIEFMAPRLMILHAAFSDGIMPPVADEATRSWKCLDYCSVNEHCMAYEENHGRKLIIPQ